MVRPAVPSKVHSGAEIHLQLVKDHMSEQTDTLPFLKMSLWLRRNSKETEVRIIENYKLVLKNMSDI